MRIVQLHNIPELNDQLAECTSWRPEIGTGQYVVKLSHGRELAVAPECLRSVELTEPDETPPPELLAGIDRRQLNLDQVPPACLPGPPRRSPTFPPPSGCTTGLQQQATWSARQAARPGRPGCYRRRRICRPGRDTNSRRSEPTPSDNQAGARRRPPHGAGTQSAGRRCGRAGLVDEGAAAFGEEHGC